MVNPAKAMEALHADASGVIGPTDNNDPPWLNTVQDVDGVVRSFGSDVLRKFAEPDTDAFMKWLETECRRLNNLFLGYQPGETEYAGWRRGPWNTPDQLGMFIRIHYFPSDDEDRFAVRDAFMRYTQDVIATTKANDGKPVDEWGWELDALTEQLVRALLGLPSGNNPEEDGDINIYGLTA